MKQINQEVIAKELNLSKATVSRCFTNHPGINPRTRARVFELASRLGYHHMSTRTPKNRKKNVNRSIGVLICTDEEEYYRKDYDSPGRIIMKGISEYCQLGKLNISVHFVDPTVTSVEDSAYDDILSTIGRNWSGLLLMYPFPSSVTDKLLVQYPCVSLVEQRGAGPLDCVDVDHYQGMSLIINSLKDLGHRRISFYSKMYKVEASWSMRRCGAFFEKMIQQGLPIKQADLINAYPSQMVSLEDSFDLAASKVKEGVTAFVCAADHQAYDLIRALRMRGIRVPEDVTVTGFDGIDAPEDIPNLSTVQIPYHQIGYTSAKRLDDLMTKRFGPTQHILLGCRFNAGNTMATPGH